MVIEYYPNRLMQYEVVFFIGPQGSGKGTQARLLAERLGFYFWEMGGILREAATEESEHGLKVKDMLARGVLFPDEFLLEIAGKKLESIPKDTGIIFDGIPRRLGQAEFLLDFLRNQGRSNFVTIFIDLPMEESFKRLLLRAQKEGREDDTEEAIRFRLEQYHKDTLPVLDFLRENSTFVTIDGSPSIEVVTEQINLALR